MRTSVKLSPTALAASLLFSAAVSAASARSLVITNQNFRITGANLEFASAATTRCEVTLEGSFHYRTILKNPRSLIGLITKAIVRRPCREGSGSAFNGVETYNGGVPANTLPWHVTYEGFTGTLPTHQQPDNRHPNSHAKKHNRSAGPHNIVRPPQGPLVS